MLFEEICRIVGRQRVLLSSLLFSLTVTTTAASPSFDSLQHFPLSAHASPAFDEQQMKEVPNPLYHEHLRLQKLHGDSFSPSSAFIPQSLFVAPIMGCASVDFTAAITIGGQGPFNLIIDTGSTTLAVASTLCTTCGVTPLYTANTANAVGTATSSKYGDGSSWTGQAYTDTVAVTGTNTANTVSTSMILSTIDAQQNGFFRAAGCDTTSATGNTNQGIMGYAYPVLAIKPTQSFFTQWNANNPTNANMFTIQMCRRTGSLWHGGYNASAFNNGVIGWAPITTKLYYVVNVIDIGVAFKTSTVTGSPVTASSSAFQSIGVAASTFTASFNIVDSGTTLWIMPTAAYNALVASLITDATFVSVFTSTFFSAGQCVSLGNGMTVAQLNAALPSVRVTFADANGANPLYLSMNAISSYVRVVQSTTNNAFFYCPGIAPTASGQIMGWSFINQFVVLHDITNSLIGFASSTTCITGDANSSPGGSVAGGVVNPSYPSQAVLPTVPPTTPTPAFAVQNIKVNGVSTIVLVEPGQTFNVTFTYIPNSATPTLMFWLTSLVSVPMYMETSVKFTGGSGVIYWTVPSDGTAATGAYQIMVGLSATNFWTGPSIYIPLAPNNPCNSNVCSFHGYCNPSSGACSCDTSYYGTTCSNYTAPPSNSTPTSAPSSATPCVNGRLINSVCYCNTNYRGSTCITLYVEMSLTFTYPYSGTGSILNQLGLLAALLEQDLSTAAALPSMNNVGISAATANAANNLYLTFRLQCNVTDTTCTAYYLATAYRALLASVDSTSSTYKGTLSGAQSQKDLVLTANSAALIANAQAPVNAASSLLALTSHALLLTASCVVALAFSIVL